MSKICGAASYCPYKPEQTTGGCPCAELCPGYCVGTASEYSTSTTPDHTPLIITGTESEVAYATRNKT